MFSVAVQRQPNPTFLVVSADLLLHESVLLTGAVVYLQAAKLSRQSIKRWLDVFYVLKGEIAENGESVSGSGVRMFVVIVSMDVKVDTWPQRSRRSRHFFNSNSKGRNVPRSAHGVSDLDVMMT